MLLMGAGFGRDPIDIASRLTWRQIQHYAAVIQRQQRLTHADTIQAIALAFGAKDLTALLRELRA